ncbi:hypothetical protein K1T71_014259 [Dendrolimus kikuchii]|uniref:Uncharacterized protein n=1 Tax=Dendrolimus kikuchii TaxID=765133 RepID=A0ACC1CFS3_9NEOP|nr:hypothetical protein K1T71_014259 [Dendrolimus kikuchii]
MFVRSFVLLFTIIILIQISSAHWIGGGWGVPGYGGYGVGYGIYGGYYRPYPPAPVYYPPSPPPPFFG